jgi:hypothetical protein
MMPPIGVPGRERGAEADRHDVDAPARASGGAGGGVDPAHLVKRARRSPLEDAMSDVWRLQAMIAASPLLAPILCDWSRIELPDCWLVAGAIAQTAWNHAFGLPPAHGIADIDIVYFDAADLSEDAEVRVASRLRGLFADLPVRLDVRNEARVHLWYEAKFHLPLAPYTSAAAAIGTFPTTVTAVGLRPRAGELELCAPFGIDDLLKGVVRPNKKQITRSIYRAKVERWLGLWPSLTVIDWDE